MTKKMVLIGSDKRESDTTLWKSMICIIVINVLCISLSTVGAFADSRTDYYRTVNIQTENGTYHLYDFNDDYIVLIFGDLDCGACTYSVDLSEMYRIDGASVKTIFMPMVNRDSYSEFSEEYPGVILSNAFSYNYSLASEMGRVYDNNIHIPYIFVYDNNGSLIFMTSGEKNELYEFLSSRIKFIDWYLYDMTLSKNKYEYTGDEIKPVPDIEVSDDIEMIEGRDYIFEYANNIKVGEASVTLKGTGIFLGEITRKFKIVPKKIKLTGLKAGRKSLTVKWENTTPDITGYQVRYKRSGYWYEWSKPVNVPSPGKTSLKISKLKTKTNYVVKVRSYSDVDGKRYYSGWSKTKKAKTR